MGLPVFAKAKVVNGLANYKVPLIDMFMYVYKEVDEYFTPLILVCFMVILKRKSPVCKA